MHGLIVYRESLQIFQTMPGMQVNAEINFGRRTVLDYLLSLIRKIAHEVGRER